MRRVSRLQINKRFRCRRRLVEASFAPFSYPLSMGRRTQRDSGAESLKLRKEQELTELEAAGAGAGEGGPARREVGASATAARCSWAKAPAIRAIARTKKVTNLNIVAELKGETKDEGRWRRRDRRRQRRCLSVWVCVGGYCRCRKEKKKEKTK